VGYFEIFKKLPKGNNHPMCEILPNLVTVVESETPFRWATKMTKTKSCRWIGLKLHCHIQLWQCDFFFDNAISAVGSVILAWQCSFSSVSTISFFAKQFLL
jgi:hypothetical protein